jgi:cell division septation protein DedD
MTANARHMIGALAIATALAAAPALADVKAGVDAWSAGRYEQAIKEWRPLADRGDADAQFNMGQAHRLGRGVPTDLKIAQSWFEKAGAQGHQEAQANAGLLLFQNGNRAEALPWLRKAADRGDARAQYVLGTALFNGDIAGKDWPRAYALMSRAAAQGLQPAKTSLGQMEQFISADDKQKGTAIAAQLAKGAAISAVADTGSVVRDTRPVRIAGQGLKPASPPSAKLQPAKPVVVAGGQPVPAPAKGDAPGDKSKAAAAQTAKLAAKPAAAPAPARPIATPGGRWRVQLGAYSNAGAARTTWNAVSKRIGALGGLQPSFEQAGAVTRLRVGPLGDRAAATRVCAAAKAAGQACFPVAP